MRIVAFACLASVLAATAGLAATNLDSVLGRSLFERDWVPAPASTDAADGLGPLFSARSCAGCHAGSALAARFTDAPDGKIAGRGLVVRFGDAAGSPDPLYGHVLQNQAVQGLLPEGRVSLSHAADGALAVAVTLERGTVALGTRQSIRVAPPIAGRAMLDRIDAASVLALADPDDADGDGISGRPRMVSVDGDAMLGRYGWKAASANLDEQVADAFATDLGLSSARRRIPYGDCTAAQADCLAAPNGASGRFGGHELSEEMVAIVATYLEGLPYPDRTLEGTGSELFASTGCASCHVPGLASVDGSEVSAYTDLLLHDMGEALDDGVGEPGVASAEWRTAPLIAVAGKGRRYLHDGRAPSTDAAIRAHGGEASAALSRYLALGDADRAALIAFVESL